MGEWIYDDVAGGETLTGGTYALIRVEVKTAGDAYGVNIAKATLVWEVNNTGSGSGRGIFDDMIVEPQAIPEPASLLMLSFGLLGLGVFTKKRTE